MGEDHLGVKVLAVDDHPPFLEALRGLIAAAPGFEMIGHARSGEEALREAGRLSPSLVVMDVVMPGMGGIAATRELLRDDPELVVLLVSVDDPALYPGTDTLGDGVVCVRKQDLRPDRLGEVWAAHHP